MTDSRTSGPLSFDDAGPTTWPGADVERSDLSHGGAQSFVTGGGAFMADLANRVDQRVLMATFVRSDIAHGEIRSLQFGQSNPGVVARYDAAALKCPAIPGALRPGVPEAIGMEREALASSTVHYVGEPIAMIVSESAACGADAADDVFIDYEEYPAVTSLKAALSDETIIYSKAGTNVVGVIERGDPPTHERYEIDVVIEVYNQRLAPSPLEPLGMLVVPEEGSRLSIWCGHQSPHRLRKQICQLFGLPEESVRVRVPDTGGGFGLRGGLYPEYVALVSAALDLRQPIMWLQSRRELFQSGSHGRAQLHRVRLRGDSDGRIRRIDTEVIADMGAFPQNGSFIPATSALCAQGPYDVDAASFRSTSVVTNLAPIGPYRGAGRPEVSYSLEVAVEAFAREVNLDSVEVRQRNLISVNSMPFESRTGAVYDGGDYQASLERLLGLIHHEKAALASRQRGPSRQLGTGVSTFIESAGGALGSGEFGRVELQPNGAITVYTGAMSTGQPHAHLLRSLVSDVLGTSHESIQIVAGDTHQVAQGIGTFGSRSTQTGATAVYRSSQELANRIRSMSADILEVSPEDLEFVADGCAVLGSPGSVLSLSEVRTAMVDAGIEVGVEEYYIPDGQTFPHGAYGAVVEVDMETGNVEVLTVAAVDDCGNALDVASVEAQVMGGMAQGIGQARYEGIRYDSSGQLLNGSLSTYSVPTATDMPALKLALSESMSETNDLGVRGVGEAGCVGVPAAIVAAVANAIGVAAESLQMPLDPQEVWAAIQNKRTDESKA